jgi:hypothetical protein
MSVKESNLTGFAELFMPSSADMPARRYDLDWLRIVAFILLILFHCGMFYVENWGWHVKSNYQSSLLENVMLLVQPWRMTILWLICGIAMRFIMAKITPWRFIRIRSFRLLLPLFFGILVVVPPQLYVEMTHNGDLNLSYWQFLKEFYTSNSDVFDKYQSGIWPHIDVNHLWFIRSLWQYSLILLCLLPLLNTKVITYTIDWLFKQHGVIALFILTLPIFIIQMSWDAGDVRYPLGFIFMLYGYLIGWHRDFWQLVSNNLKPMLILFIVSYCILILFYNKIGLDLIKEQSILDECLLLLRVYNYSLLKVVGALTVFSIAYKYFNKPSSKLSYVNEGVYPFYILHQTFIVVIGYNLSQLNLGPFIEPMLLIFLTVVSCFITYEIIRNVDVLRPLFGLKMTGSYRLPMRRLGYSFSSVLILIIGFEILI